MPMSAAAETNREAGFSLVEVLCAMTIAVAGIVVLSQGATGSLKAARSLDMRQGAQLILQSILQDELAAGDTAPAVREGDSGAYRWQLQIVPTAEGAARKLPPSHRMYRLSASVTWGAGSIASASVLKLGR
jgi:prepilin-type N-terminal cleavage/methylation domain-containing protein